MYATTGTAGTAPSIARRPFRPAGDSNSLKRLFRARGTPVSFRRNSTILSEGDTIESIYSVDTGFVRCCSYSEGGLRQIFRFAGPGDQLGFPDLDSWHFTAEAVGPVTVRAIRPEVLDAALIDDPAIARALRRHCVEQFTRRERHMVWLSHLHADDRLLAFLEDFAPLSSGADGFGRLPMTRQDLGDHLGMTLETVSRSFGLLKRRGVLSMEGTSRYRLHPDGDRASAA